MSSISDKSPGSLTRQELEALVRPIIKNNDEEAFKDFVVYCHRDHNISVRLFLIIINEVIRAEIISFWGIAIKEYTRMRLDSSKRIVNVMKRTSLDFRIFTYQCFARHNRYIDASIILKLLDLHIGLNQAVVSDFINDDCLIPAHLLECIKNINYIHVSYAALLIEKYLKTYSPLDLINSAPRFPFLQEAIIQKVITEKSNISKFIFMTIRIDWFLSSAPYPYNCNQYESIYLDFCQNLWLVMPHYYKYLKLVNNFDPATQTIIIGPHQFQTEVTLEDLSAEEILTILRTMNDHIGSLITVLIKAGRMDIFTAPSFKRDILNPFLVMDHSDTKNFKEIVQYLLPSLKINYYVMINKSGPQLEPELGSSQNIEPIYYLLKKCHENKKEETVALILEHFSDIIDLNKYKFVMQSEVLIRSRFFCQSSY